MTTIYINHKNSKGMQLNGNVLSGDTYPVKEYIKAYCGGKWNSVAKAWTVDVDKIMTLVNTKGSQISIADEPKAEITHNVNNGLCPRCHSYCYGDCTSR